MVGVQKAERHLPDLILCDVNMPNLDGYGTLAELRKKPATAAIPFIFLTGVADKNHMRQGMDLGADDYLTKPFSLDELIAAVNARLRKQAEMVERSEQKLADLRGSISLALPHELLTPLNGIIGFSSILMQDHQTVRPPEILEFSQHIYNSATRLHRLIENFLIYSHLELILGDSEKLQAFRQSGERIFLRDVLQNVVQQKAQTAQRESDVLLNYENVCLLVSSENLKKILEEVLDNALKFSDAGTAIHIHSARAGSSFTLTVTDHGRGMTPEQIASVGAHMQFERKFYEQQGSGLGLTIARRLTELHGGRLTIESTPGRETHIHITLPLPRD